MKINAILVFIVLIKTFAISLSRRLKLLCKELLLKIDCNKIKVNNSRVIIILNEEENFSMNF